MKRKVVLITHDFRVFIKVLHLNDNRFRISTYLPPPNKWMPTNYTREEQIELEVARIEQSTLSANEYIQRYGASFSLIQFYRYRDKLSREGIIGLRDKRKDGNHQKLNSVEMAARSGFIRSKPNVRTSEHDWQ